ncbi:UpxY family transcription antiterminator [soil metagenome]
MSAEKKNIKLWYALYVNVRHEKKVVEKMMEKGIECYVPILKKMSQWSDRKKLVEKPLIPGYVFVCLRKEEMDQPRYINGVLNYIRFNGKPAAIRSEEIEGLKYFIENGFSVEEINEEEFQVGDKVKFKLSGFKEYIAVIEKFQGDNFAIISFEGVGKNYRLKATVKALKKIIS